MSAELLVDRFVPSLRKQVKIQLTNAGKKGIMITLCEDLIVRVMHSEKICGNVRETRDLNLKQPSGMRFRHRLRTLPADQYFHLLSSRLKGTNDGPAVKRMSAQNAVWVRMFEI